MANQFLEQNTASRARLSELASSLTDDDLRLRTSYDWTVGALFAHMTWWDQRVLVLLRRWKRIGLDESPTDSELINEALKPLCHAIDPRVAIKLCLASAEETDAEIAATAPDLIKEIVAGPTHFRFNRALHRNDHVRDIEALVSASRE